MSPRPYAAGDGHIYYSGPPNLTNGEDDDYYDDTALADTIENDIRVLQSMGQSEYLIDRRPFDKWWTIFFIAAVISLISILVKSTMEGSVGSLSHPKNYQGLACGYDAPVKHLPYLYFPVDPKKSTKKIVLAENRAMCVVRCPSQKDVEAKGFIPISDASVAQDKTKSTFVSVLHSIRSPVYAAQSHDSTYCIPDHPELKHTVQQLISRRSTTSFQDIATSIIKFLPLAICLSGVSALASHLLAASMSKAAGFTACSCLITSIVTLFGFGVKLLFTRTQPTGESIFIPGLINIGMGIGLSIWLGMNWEPLGEACKIAEATSECYSGIRNVAGLNLMLQLAGFFAGIISLISFSMVQSCIHPVAKPLTTSLDSNGGLLLTPLERDWTGSISIDAQSIAVILISVWLLETIICLVKYITAYLGIVYYFTPEEADGSRLLHDSLPVFAMTQALKFSSGSLALLATLRWISRGVRMIFMTIAASRFDTELTSNGLSPVEKHAKVTGRSATHKVCDLIHNGLITEMAMTSKSSLVAIMVSEKRLAKSQHSLAAGMIGLSSLITWSTLCCIGTLTYAATASVILALNNSKAFGVASTTSPFITAALIAMFVTYIAGIHLTCFDTMADALLYCTMVDDDARRAAGPTIMDKDGLPLAHTCPHVIADLLEDAQRARDREALAEVGADCCVYDE